MNIHLVLSPKYLNCTPIYENNSNATVVEKMSSNMSSENIRKIGSGLEMRKTEPRYYYSPEYGRSILTDVRIN